MFVKEGYRLLGWGDAGMGRLFSKKPILKPEDYKTARPWMAKDDPAMPVLLKMIGANGVPLGIPEVFPALQTGMIDTVLVSAIAAVALQWFRYLTHMSTDTSIAIVGATLVREDVFKTIAPDHQKILLETGKKAHASLIAQVQKEDLNAYKTLLSRGMIEFDPLKTPEQKAVWNKLNTELIEKLTGRIFPKDLLERVRAAAKS
jgi:TRAP-type C4-dicarboxylate transport system substrate-binding protein